MKLAASFVEVDQGEREPSEISVRRFAPIGQISGNGSVSISAFETIIPSKQLLFQGVRFEVASGNEYASEGLTTLSIGDAEKLVLALDQLAATKIATDQFPLTEVEAAVSDLKVILFNTDRQQLIVAVSVSGTTCHLFKQSQLFEIAKLVQLALDHLKAVGSQR